MLTKFQLKNGLKVILFETKKSPVVTVQMWVKTGSADENPGEEGVSHFIEHLLFKGTEKFKVGEIAGLVESSGGQLNAYTSFDQTVYHVTLSRQFADLAMDVIHQMIFHPKFDSDEINNEREVVIEEIKRSNDSPARRASRMLFSESFNGHPYSRPVIGYDEVINTIPREKIYDYYSKRYAPENMNLVIVGDFKTKEMKSRIEDMYGAEAKRNLDERSRTEVIDRKSRKSITEKNDFEEDFLHLTWPIPSATHEDIPALDMLAMIIGQGESSRIYHRIRLQEATVNSIYASSFTPKDDGLFVVSATLNGKNADKVLSSVEEEILKIMKEPPTQEELDRAILNLESDEFYGMETVDGLARKLGTFELLTGDCEYFSKYIDQVKSLTPKDIQFIAQKYFHEEGFRGIFMTSQDLDWAKKQLDGFGKGFGKVSRIEEQTETPRSTDQKESFSFIKKEKVTGDSEKFEVVKFRNGAKAILIPSYETPVISVKTAYRGGVRAENINKIGVSELLSRVWGMATENQDELTLKTKIESLAAGLSSFGGRNTSGMSMTMLSEFQSELAPIFKEALLSPAFDDKIIKREKNSQLEDIRSMTDSPAQVASLQFNEMMFEGHPYAKSVLGTKESVEGLTAEDIEAYYHSAVFPKNMLTTLVGDFDVGLWKETLQAIDENLKGKKEFKDKVFPLDDIDTEKKSFLELQKEQTHLFIGYRGLTLDSPNRYALMVMNSILAGQGGRLFIELRDKASMAYTVAPYHLEGVDTGFVGAYIGCSPEKAKKAIEMIKVEFKKLIETKIQSDELDRGKSFMIGRHDIELQRNSSICSSILFNEVYGIPAQETFEFADRIKTVTSEEIQDLAGRLYTQPAVISVVGPEKPW